MFRVEEQLATFPTLRVLTTVDMDLDRYFSVRKHQYSRNVRDGEDEHIRSYLPLLASPVNEDAREVLSSCTSDIEKTTTATRGGESSVTEILAGNGRTSSGNIVIYKPHHEASSIELFYDLFFVANLGKRLRKAPLAFT